MSSNELARAGGPFGVLLSGAVAGLTVDMTLYPIDTVKTRLQSELGFKRAGGFRRIYADVPSVMVGSAPGSALFFSVYETSKFALASALPPAKSHMLAASLGEIAACAIRVPTEVVKQRAQANAGVSPLAIFRKILNSEGLRGFYRGYWSTICREVPFSLIQFPLWERLKTMVAAKRRRGRNSTTSFESAACGSLAGAIAASATTPLDVAKTRIMLAERHEGKSLRVGQVLKGVWRAKGVKGLFAGVLPRTAWISIGGFVFFGAFEAARKFFGFVGGPSDEVELFSNQQLAPYERFGVERIVVGVKVLFYELVETLFLRPLAKDSPKTFDEVKKRAADFDREVATYRAEREQTMLDNTHTRQYGHQK